MQEREDRFDPNREVVKSLIKRKVKFPKLDKYGIKIPNIYLGGTVYGATKSIESGEWVLYVREDWERRLYYVPLNDAVPED